MSGLHGVGGCGGRATVRVVVAGALGCRCWKITRLAAARFCTNRWEGAVAASVEVAWLGNDRPQRREHRWIDDWRRSVQGLVICWSILGAVHCCRDIPLLLCSQGINDGFFYVL